jgi:endoglucanase
MLRGEWDGVPLDRFGVWSDDSDIHTLNTSGINLRYANMLGDVEPTAHYVIDTSRNGAGPWAPPAYPDPQDWCNPPGRDIGLAPTLDTGDALLDAYLWIKIPGESDGECTRGLGTAGETVDPEWDRIDPAAGAWFPEMALDLVTMS